MIEKIYTHAELHNKVKRAKKIAKRRKKNILFYTSSSKLPKLEVNGLGTYHRLKEG